MIDIRKLAQFLIVLQILFAAHEARCEDLAGSVKHAYATNSQDQTKIHYVSVGEGPLLVFVHGFPDYWYSWEHQMQHLSSDYRCVALDLRGYNLSDQPQGVEHYDMSLLVQDVISVIEACNVKSATVIAHDWGGAIAWTLAMSKPDYVDNLIVCNLPHPRGLKRELLINDEHRRGTQYARDFQDPEYHKRLTPEGITALLEGLTKSPWDETKRERYRAAFKKSNFDSMLNYYRRNYSAELQEKPELPYRDDSELIKVKMPVLMFHGLQDKALHHHALNNTWEWVEKDLTIVTLPQAGHWVHHDEAETVSTTIDHWLKRYPH